MAVGNLRQSAYSSSASKRPLRSERRIIPEPSLVGLRRSFVVHIQRFIAGCAEVQTESRRDGRAWEIVRSPFSGVRAGLFTFGTQPSDKSPGYCRSSHPGLGESSS